MVRTHPQWLRAREVVKSGRIGPLRSAIGFFSYFNVNPANIRNIPDCGGGALMDVGCYPITTSRFMFGEEPSRVLGLVERDPVMKVDRLTSGDAGFSFGAIHLHLQHTACALPKNAFPRDQGPHRARDSIQRSERPANPDLYRRWSRPLRDRHLHRNLSGLRSVHHSGRCFLEGNKRETGKSRSPSMMESKIWP